MTERPWDRRVTDALAHDAWLAANRPEDRRKAAPFRTKIRSGWFWLSLLPLAVTAAALLIVSPHGWLAAVMWVAYFAALAAAPRVQRRIRQP
jgi:cobalamin synthase